MKHIVKAIPKEETLKEVAEKYAEIYKCPATNENEYCRHDIISAINFGAKWHQERSYSEAIDLFITEIKTEFKDDNWDYLEFIKERVLKQFKNK